MKVKDFDLRVWDNVKGEYNNEREVLLSSNGSIYRINTITGELQELEYAPLEIELFTGFTDREGNKIYEGDTIDEFSCGMLMNNPCEIVFKNGCFCRKFANKEIAFVEGLEQGKEQESLAKIFANCVIIRNKEYEYQGEYDDDWVEEEEL